jgi:hypothetical protein
MSEDKKTEETGLPVANFGAILGASTEKTKWVEIPEWNAKVKIRALTKADQVKLRQRSATRGVVDETKLEMNLLVAALVEPKVTFAEVDELFAKSDAKAISRLTAAALTLSGLTEDYIGEAEADMKS